MVNTNVSLVKTLYGAFGRGEISKIVAAAAEDCRWEVVGRPSDFPTLGAHKGRAGVRRFFDSVDEHLTFHEFVPGEFHALDDKVFVIGHYAMTVKKTGRSFAGDWIHIFTIRNDQIVDFREFTDTARAAEAYRDGGAHRPMAEQSAGRALNGR